MTRTQCEHKTRPRQTVVVGLAKVVAKGNVKTRTKVQGYKGYMCGCKVTYKNRELLQLIGGRILEAYEAWVNLLFL